MFFSKRIGRKRLTLVKPDYTEKKNSRHLLIWKNVPYWMVVDEEFHNILAKCDGEEYLEKVLSDASGDRTLDKTLLSEISNLMSLGILKDVQAGTKVSIKNRKQPVLLENISVNITRQCNLRCPFCYNIETQAGSINKELTCDEIIKFIRSTKPFLSDTPSLALVGGEPLIFPQKVITVSEYAIKHRFNTLVSTNGTKITDKFAQQAHKTGLEVQVSIDGHNAETNDPLRGKGSFEKACRGIEILVKHDVYSIMCMVCHSDNFEYLQDFYELADGLGVNEARFIPLKLVGGGGKCGLKPVRMQEMMKKAVCIFNKRKDLSRLMGRDCFTITANTCRLSNKRLSCGTGLQTLLLDSDGTIYPCLNTNFNEFKVANIRDKEFDFVQTWKNSPVLNEVRLLTSIENINNVCSDCLERYWCLGGFRGETYTTRGRLNTKAYNCKDLHKSIIEMFWILADNSDWIKTMKYIG